MFVRVVQDQGTLFFIVERALLIITLNTLEPIHRIAKLNVTENL
jgi:hypothetical protein